MPVTIGDDMDRSEGHNSAGSDRGKGGRGSRSCCD